MRSLARGIPTRSSSSMLRARASAAEISSCAWICSAIWWPIRWTGLSAAIASWKTIAISAPRIERSSSSEAPISSVPP